MVSVLEAKPKSRRGGFSQWVKAEVEEKPEPIEEENTLTEEKTDTTEVDSDDTGASCESVPAKGLADDEQDALRQYTEKFGESRDGTDSGYNRVAFPWFKAQPVQTPQVSTEVLHAALARQPREKKITKQSLWEVDSEGEEVPLCTRCSLPVGEFSYQGREGKQTCVHPECMAQVLIQDRQREEENRNKRESVKKQKNRREYDIGWRMDSVPKNQRLAERMGCSPAPEGLCCLVLDEASRTVKVAATLEPSAAINLEYLLLALKVRKTAKREPLFSLDPVDPQNLEKTPQKKVYEPAWLAGTSVGDVMFQADYFLKELALGEYDMPVVGMLSVFDWSEMSGRDKTWAGREWFVVKKAEVRAADDNTLIPHVKMGVEAREQIVTKKGLEDAAVTATNHPLKKFADAFTRNFDVIAERKSVVFHLRELAKASVMAKYLVDSKARLDPSWYKMADEIVKGTEPEAFPEIPQLWNMRGNSRIQLRNGKLVDVITGGQSRLQAIYGGVEFGLDRFELAQRHALQGSTARPGMPLAQSGRPLFMPQRFQLGQRGEMPQGVDLNLDKFSLSKEDRFNKLPPCSGGPNSLEAKVTLGRAFLQGLQQRFAEMKPSDQKLLLNIFNVPQCDRTEEGEAFVPPDPNLEYITKVRGIVGEEESIRNRRKQRFSDKSFSVTNPGPEFPRSWTPSFQVEMDGRVAETAPTKFGLHKLEVDEELKNTLLSEVLPSASPEFKKTTEDGFTFCIYKIGSLEVRTVREREGEESICVIFSSGSASWETKSVKPSEVLEKERVSKCKIYVEAAEDVSCHYYVVLETQNGTAVVTDVSKSGTVSWLPNPRSLEDRNSLAKLLFQSDAKDNMSIRDVKLMSEEVSLPPGASMHHRKQYAKAIFKSVTGRPLRGKWGGNMKKYAPPPSGEPGRLGLAAMGRSSDFLNVMWLARSSNRQHEVLKPKIPACF
eukprot:CAMPEP_0181423022 /NCGR_PEP_ID=MMETSP1110-20121109/13915_1 /TAXON_ID=174948 /ORGANISM="Symbiodinium sp., Strain CCMP421" /LENGTH=947 /DNA_ID=CAMNT_0023546137 /DNA_START=96 /DNA_END=2939 /DNA_ORIENTATION=-